MTDEQTKALNEMLNDYGTVGVLMELSASLMRRSRENQSSGHLSVSNKFRVASVSLEALCAYLAELP